MAAAQLQRGGEDRRDQRVQPLVAAHEHDGDAPTAIATPAVASAIQLDVAGADLAEQAVADDDEQREDHGDVEQPLGEQRAEHGLLRRRRARGHQEHAHGVARARGQDVVARVADDVEPLRVGAARRGALGAQQRAPALAAHERGERVERDRAGQRAPLGRGCRGTCGGSCRSAHQTTPATASDRDRDQPTSERRESPRRGARGPPASPGVARRVRPFVRIASTRSEGSDTVLRMAAARELVIADEPGAWARLGFAPGRRCGDSRSAAGASRRAGSGAGAGPSSCPRGAGGRASRRDPRGRSRFPGRRRARAHHDRTPDRRARDRPRSSASRDRSRPDRRHRYGEREPAARRLRADHRPATASIRSSLRARRVDGGAAGAVRRSFGSATPSWFDGACRRRRRVGGIAPCPAVQPGRHSRRSHARPGSPSRSRSYPATGLIAPCR